MTTDNGTPVKGAAKRQCKERERGCASARVELVHARSARAGSQFLPLLSRFSSGSFSICSQCLLFLSVDLLSVEMFVWGRVSFRQLQACFFRLLCFIPTGLPVISVDSQRSTDNITIRQGDTAVIR